MILMNTMNLCGPAQHGIHSWDSDFRGGTCNLPQHLCFQLSCKMVSHTDSFLPWQTGVHTTSKRDFQVGSAEKPYSVWVFQPAQLK